jgi:hypothetical protein
MSGSVTKPSRIRGETMEQCYFCSNGVDPKSGFVDIGGLPLCPTCYESRAARTEMSCNVCGIAVQGSYGPLTTHNICSECEEKADLQKAYLAASKRDPCDRCGDIHSYHHATVYGQNLCHNCWEKSGRTCTQMYCGDKGYPAFATKPSIPALVLPPIAKLHNTTFCTVCLNRIADPTYLIARFGLVSICGECRGPKWWDYMEKHRDELSRTC